MQDVGSKENTSETQTEPPCDGKSPNVNPLDTVSLLETEARPPASKSIERYPYRFPDQRFLRELKEYTNSTCTT